MISSIHSPETCNGMLKNILLVGLGGGLGSMLRYGAGLAFDSRQFPLATLSVNIAGSFIMGLILAAAVRDQAFADNWKLFLATGVCGGFTTFSAFSAENLLLLQNGRFSIAFLYIGISIIAGIGAAWLGFKLFNLNS